MHFRNRSCHDNCNLMDVFSFLSTHARNTSSSKTENLIYIRPYALSVLVQPSDGEVGKELPVQPRLVFLDKQVTGSWGTVSIESWEHVVGYMSHIYWVVPKCYQLHWEPLETLSSAVHLTADFLPLSWVIKSKNKSLMLFLSKSLKRVSCIFWKSSLSKEVISYANERMSAITSALQFYVIVNDFSYMWLSQSSMKASVLNSDFSVHALWFYFTFSVFSQVMGGRKGNMAVKSAFYSLS